MTSALWTFTELAEATGGTFVGAGNGGPTEAGGINFDSRGLTPGDIFLALQGVRDGHDFVPQAFVSGAVVAITRRPVEGGPCLLVPDVQRALEDLGVFARNRAATAKRGAVTGSVGKTSVTQMVMQGLRRAGKAHSAIKSFNNHIGVPLTLARMPRDTERAVFEIGMNHADEITPLSEFVAPHAVIITTVGAVHTENFPDGEQGVARAKAEIFDGLLPGGLAILNADNRWFDFLSSEARGAGALVSAFGEGGGNDAQLVSHIIAGERARVEARFHGRDIAFSLSHTGKHQAVNALSVLLMLEALGVDLDTSIASLEDAPTLEGRGKVTEKAFGGGTITIIDESYNANPVSMVATLKSLAETNKGDGRKIVVMTDMLELGPDEADLHAGLSATLEALDIDRVYLAGPLMKNLWDVLPERLRGRYAASAADLTDGLTADLRSGDLVMVKGSNGSKAGLIAKTLLSA
ncbi:MULTISPECIES: UDP-N-acetylmuramoyl-tripeptide--D-alanyl-D-alanine ligase [Asticcacaulis]|uniref:UDP-N-acetylmuramoyl-tripeptide--D-alanyl-D- alanine ligase n=1 Tax=Asticcacaulis TaxID=76890 RepID=UPI001AE1B422|nr:MULTISPECIES: UDP-N-acetylmuramoyl-tripeptide--D-alanyl-D-alanine ligase [Asticcacaulis]MBP2157634.1 UDP-N-acetylmuramoyl-tripeptide--D-alanyl-D-alanine ligase [Asticcacaulis solisilvae]MDR6798679.1 UDP-N-acetylmuramoyl-tripeptide--D-alanyl-D-alanine ligase [Asticcacaulis sp. BE141]